MMDPLIHATALREALASSTPPRLFDCRARLDDPEAGARLWREGHLPGSLHLDLDRDLAAPAGAGGRHPLPSPAAFTAVVQRLGLTPEQPVVLYDDAGGQLAAARAWWMLAVWAGHPRVQVLDGGVAAWQAAGGDWVTGSEPAPRPSDWRPRFDDAAWVDADQVARSAALLIDARAPARFRGEAEPIDPVAGHIPGARNRPSASNLTAEGRFVPAAELTATLPDAEATIAYCGSGITACHNVLAYAVAGRPLPRLYAGSWSEWVKDPARPVATGDA